MSRSRLTVPVALLVVVAAACGGSGAPGVLVNPLATDIVFGLADEPVAAPANFPTPVAAPVQSTGGLIGPAPAPTIPEFKSSGPSVFQGGGTESACPAAALTEFPDESASVLVVGEPNEGVYQFRSVVTTRVGDTSPKEVAAFVDHEVRDVERTSDIEFEFDLVQPDVNSPVAGRSVIQHFVVNTNPELLVNESEGGQTLTVVDVPGADVQVPVPGAEAGIFLTRIEVVQDDESLSVFEPSTPVKYLALDEGIVTPGDTWNTVSVDPATGDVMVHDGTVTRKNRIDACGEIVEGWEVEAEQTFNGATRNYRYTIATQYGAMFIGEVTNFVEGDATTQVEVHLADQSQLIADPVAGGDADT